ncbi:MAG TPA: BON domain-containing protein [Thermoanaerobaculia bacterium]|nr:BON domain-containing protein [Thermoanaerobaculia bacterium]
MSTDTISTPQVRDDNDIAGDVRKAIAEAAPAARGVEVTVASGVVTLNGQVASEEQRRTIGAAALKVRGVRSVINNLAFD